MKYEYLEIVLISKLEKFSKTFQFYQMHGKILFDHDGDCFVFLTPVDYQPYVENKMPIPRYGINLGKLNSLTESEVDNTLIKAIREFREKLG